MTQYEDDDEEEDGRILSCGEKPEDFDGDNPAASLLISDLIDFFGRHDVQGKPLTAEYVDDPDQIMLRFQSEHHRDSALAITRSEESGGLYDE
jgi:hypothetical protein